jgi:hypothetical protein
MDEERPVVVVGVRIEYWELVGFLLKLFLAGIPVGLLLGVCWLLLLSLVRFLGWR